MGKLITLKINDIKINKRQWKLSEDNILDIMHSIKKVGEIQPPTVRLTDDGYVLVTGNHRLEAMKRLGYTEVQVISENINEKLAILREIDENLVRRTMTFLEEGKQLETRKKIYDEEHKDWFRNQQYLEYMEKLDLQIFTENFPKKSAKLFSNIDIDYLLEKATSKEKVQWYFDNYDLDSLFGHYDDMQFKQITKEQRKKLLGIKEFFKINLPIVEEYNFYEEVNKLTGKSKNTVDKKIQIASNLNEEQHEKLKECATKQVIDVATKIKDENIKDELIDFIAEKAENKHKSELRGMGSMLTKIVDKIEKEEPEISEKELVDKVKEQVNEVIKFNEENNQKAFSTKFIDNHKKEVTISQKNNEMLEKILSQFTKDIKKFSEANDGIDLEESDNEYLIRISKKYLKKIGEINKWEDSLRKG